MTTEEYHALTATPSNLQGHVSKSMLWAFAKSPFKWFNGKGFKGNAKTEFGSLVHALCFEHTVAHSRYMVIPDDAPRDVRNDSRIMSAKKLSQNSLDAIAYWDALDAENAGKIMVDPDDMAKAQTIAATVMESEYIYSYGACDYEVQVQGMVGVTPMKGMIDIAPHSGNNLGDLKVTGSIGNEEAMARHIANMGYHWQGAMYLDLYNAIHGTTRNEFDLIFVEEDAPHEMAVFTLSENFLDKGREGYMNAIHRWQQCVATKNFPPSHATKTTVEPPKWI